MSPLLKRNIKDNKRNMRSKKSISKKKKTLSSFFGKLPTIEDGLKFQKTVRNEWK